MFPSKAQHWVRCLMVAAGLALPGLTACSTGADAEASNQSSPHPAADAGNKAGSSKDGGLALGDGKADDPSQKSCDNSLDTEGCPCTQKDATRACYSGPSAQAGIGQCKKGTQTCKSSTQGEFSKGVWSACEGSGAPLTCAQAKATCGTASDGCGGQIQCGDPCPQCTPGSQTFSAAGSYDFTVPGFDKLTVELWGGGGGGAAYSQVDSPTPGGSSSFNSTVVAGGGKDGASGAAGGVASGGTINTPGGAGKGIPGGDSPNGGKGGSTATQLDACGSMMYGSPSGDGENGYAPGGGGMGDITCQLSWWTYQGWGFYGVGAGAGAFASITYSAGELKAGSQVPIVVGEGGRGSKGATSSGPAGTGKNPGYYTAGDGAPGQVTITWTCL
ncbi:MAG: hypothetical protein HY898_31390 [Deltaproteobacteria bacterium]|nr:hypothetical protein [Deltaproteobacteria bacterium]